ncbi:MAG: hypothetical protein ACRC92_14290 [Peptostreptococcaceae bacterium]
MYIDLNVIYFILALLGCIAIVYVIITLNNINKLIKTSNELMLNNKDSINKSLVNLPNVVANFSEVSENMKDVTEVVTDVTADFIVTKDNIKSNMEIGLEILNILRSVFSK